MKVNKWELNWYEIHLQWYGACFSKLSVQVGVTRRCMSLHLRFRGPEWDELNMRNMVVMRFFTRESNIRTPIETNKICSNVGLCSIFLAKMTWSYIGCEKIAVAVQFVHSFRIHVTGDNFQVFLMIIRWTGIPDNFFCNSDEIFHNFVFQDSDRK